MANKNLGIYEKYIGIRLTGGIFDQWMLEKMRQYIEIEIQDCLSANIVPTRTEIGKRLGMDRQRVSRIAKALEITHLLA